MTTVEKMRVAVLGLSRVLDDARLALGNTEQVEQLQQSYDRVEEVLDVLEHEETEFQECEALDESRLSPQMLWQVAQALKTTEWQVEAHVDDALRRLCEKAEGA